MMHEVSQIKVANSLGKEEKREYQSRHGEPMTCQERLSHAIQIDHILIYPNQTTIVEGVKQRNISESHEERVGSKHQNNVYNLNHGNRDHHAHFDDREWHEKMLEEQDQTWYFVLADCDGALEIFRDEKSKRDHLLGLSVLWHDIQESQDPVAYYEKY